MLQHERRLSIGSVTLFFASSRIHDAPVSKHFDKMDLLLSFRGCRSYVYLVYSVEHWWGDLFRISVTTGFQGPR